MIQMNPKLTDPDQLVRLFEASILTTDEARAALNLPPKEAAPLVIDSVALQAGLSAIVTDFERQIEERLKRALRTALEGVLAEFTDGLGEAVAAEAAEPRPTDLAALLASLEARQEAYARRFEECIKRTNDRFAKLLGGIAA